MFASAAPPGPRHHTRSRWPGSELDRRRVSQKRQEAWNLPDAWTQTPARGEGGWRAREGDESAAPRSGSSPAAPPLCPWRSE